MKIAQVIERATSDSDYALELVAKISRLSNEKGVRGSHNDEIWAEILGGFAENADELARLKAVNSPVAGSTWWTATVLTTTVTTTTAVCTTTTTTPITTMTTAQSEHVAPRE